MFSAETLHVGRSRTIYAIIFVHLCCRLSRFDESCKNFKSPISIRVLPRSSLRSHTHQNIPRFSLRSSPSLGPKPASGRTGSLLKPLKHYGKVPFKKGGHDEDHNEAAETPEEHEAYGQHASAQGRDGGERGHGCREERSYVTAPDPIRLSRKSGESHGWPRTVEDDDVSSAVSSSSTKCFEAVLYLR